MIMRRIFSKIRSYIRGRLLVYFTLLVVIILLISIIPLYLTYSAKLKNQIIEINSSQLSQIQNGLDQLFKDIDRTSLQLSEDINIKQYIFMTKNNLFSDEVERQFLLRKIYDVMSNEERYYANSTSIYMYVKQSQMVTTSSQAISIDRFIEGDFVSKVASENTIKRWSGIREAYLSEIQGKSIGNKVITLSRSISNYDPATDAILFIDVEVKMLNRFFNNFKSEYPLILLVSDDAGNPVYLSQKHLELSNEEMLQIFNNHSNSNAYEDPYIVSQISSEYNNWTYSIAVPRTWLFSSMKFLSNMTFIITVVVLLMGLLISYALVRRYNKPFQRTLMNWRTQRAYAHDSADLYAIVNDLVLFNQQYSEIITDHRSMLKNKILIDILKNNEWHENDIFPIAFKKDEVGFTVACLLLDEVKELSERDKSLVLLAAANIIQEVLLNNDIASEIAQLDDRSIAIITNFSPFVDRIIQRALWAEVKQMVAQYLKYSWSMGIGSSYEQSSDISKSYRESKQALQYRIYHGKGSIIAYDELNITGNIQMHDEDWLRHKEEMMTAIRTKDELLLEREIGALCDQIQSIQGISMTQISYIFHSVLLDFEKIMHDLNLDKHQIFTKEQSIYAVMDKCDTLIELKDSLTVVGINIIQFLNSKAITAKSSFLPSVKAFIEQHYHEDIGLDYVAEHFSLNPSYLGQLMKKEFNLTFLQYLTELRIREGKRLLAESNLKMYEIGTEIGYSNRSTFIRVFKQHVGVTPTEYRNRLLMNKQEA